MGKCFMPFRFMRFSILMDIGLALTWSSFFNYSAYGFAYAALLCSLWLQ